MWQRADCPHVLPLVTATQYFSHDPTDLSLAHLQCRVAIHRQEPADRSHVLFAQDGRTLQLEICGSSRFTNGVLAMPVLPQVKLRSAHTIALRRFTDLMAVGTLRPTLYKPLPAKRVSRLIELLRTLDGSLAGASPKDIALAFYGAARIRRDWHYPNNYLRDHVCRAIDMGQKLMNGGYRYFLK